MEKEIKLINDTFEYDQKLRYNSNVSMEILDSFCDTLNIIVKDIINRIGLASPDKVGDRAAHNFLILLDHMSDKKYFCSVVEEKKLIDLGFDKPAVALLVDKLLNIQGKKQKFGTILEAYKDGKGNIRSRAVPIDDEENVEKRRKDFGMRSLAEYVKESNKVFKKINRKNTTLKTL